PNEYGFYSNVNPNVDHPRWSQKTERRLGEFLKRPTLMFNGYDQVASLYSGMDLKKNFVEAISNLTLRAASDEPDSLALLGSHLAAILMLRYLKPVIFLACLVPLGR